MLNEMFAPFKRISGVVAGTVKEFAEVHVEIQQERFHAVDIGQSNAEIAAILFCPHFKRVFLRISKTRAQSLTCL